MSIKLSAMMQVYNEEVFLPYTLAGMLPVVDEFIIVDGSDTGPSTDASASIIHEFSLQYPGKIKYSAGKYQRPDGIWDETGQNNDALRQVTGDFVIRGHADLIYDVEEMERIRSIIEHFPDKKCFYCPSVTFFCDTDHIDLPIAAPPEARLRREICGGVVAVAMDIKPHHEDTGEYNRSGLVLDIDWQKDTIYMPHVKRFHYSYVRPFRYLVERKVVRYIKKGDFGEEGAKLKQAGEEAMYRYAIDMVKNWPFSPTASPYAGSYPTISETLRGMNIMDGYHEFMDWFHEEFDIGRV